MKEQSRFYIDEKGNKFWYLPSKGKRYFHRLDGPAMEYADGTKIWCVNNKRHRLDGPAAEYVFVEYSFEAKEWWVDDKIHRLDGPAWEGTNGTVAWRIDNELLPTEEVEKWLKENKINLKTETGQVAFKLRWL